MALEDQYLQETKPSGPTSDKWSKLLAADDQSENATSLGGFDCNICLESVHDPVVTLCGHLFCWPCIYKWLQFKTGSSQQCPVCKSEVTQSSLVPLYGRGGTHTAAKPCSKGKSPPNLGIIVPKRPTFCGAVDQSPRTVLTPLTPLLTPQTSTSPVPYGRAGGYYSGLSPQRGDRYMASPSVGLYGETMYARMFGNSITNLYTYPNLYQMAGNGSPRVRRHVMQADRSLGRISFFLMCCILLCLLLF